MAERQDLDRDVSSYRWTVLMLWNLCGSTGYMMMSTLGILLPSITTSLSLSPSQQGLLGSSAFWGSLAFGIPMSWWASRFRVKALTTVTLALGSLFLFAQGLAPVFATLLAGRLAFGVTRLAAEPARALLIQQWFPKRELVVANSISNAIWGLAVGGGFLATPFILSAIGDDWRTTYHVYGAYFAGLTVLWMTFGRDRTTGAQRPTETSQEAGRLMEALKHRDLWIAGFGFMGVTAAWSAFLAFFPTLMLDTYDVPLRWTGGLLALGIVVGGVSGLGVGYAVSISGNRKALLVALGLLMAGSYVGMALTGRLPVLVGLLLINGAAWGFWPILSTVPFQLRGIRPREVAVAVAFTMTMMSAGTAFGPLAAGFLQEALGDLRLTLTIAGSLGLSLCVAGLQLSPGLQGDAPRIGASHDPAGVPTPQPTETGDTP